MLQNIINSQNWMQGDAFYWFCALAGSGMFILQFGLNLIGLGDQEGFDEGAASDAGSFKWLSRQAVTGFLMMFGWSALACENEFDLVGAPRIAIAILCGIVAIMVTGCIFQIAKKFHSNGTVFNIEDTINKEAVVYQRIPHGGVGKITVCVENFVREIDACSCNQEELPSFVRVKIMSKADDKTVVVERIKEE